MCYNHSMNTTIRNLDERAYRALKARAVLEGKTMGQAVNEAIRAYPTKFREQREFRLSFVDAAIVALARDRGATTSATFDKDFSSIADLEVVPEPAL
jgi:predicted nucleic acid-binding protein